MLTKHVVGLLLLSSAWGWLVASAPDHNVIPPYKRVLNPAQAKQVAELEKAIAHLIAGAKFAEACQPAEEVLALRTEAQGKEHWEAVSARIGLEVIRAVSKRPAGDQQAFAGIGKLHEEAHAFVNRRLYSQAQPLLEQMLAIRRQVLGEQHPLTASSYHNLAANLDDQSQYAQAQPLYEKALAICRQVLGEQDPDTASSYNSLAANLDAQGQHPQAQPLCEKALAIRRQLLGELHSDTAASYNQVALNLYAQAKYAQAQPLYEKALAIRRQALGEQHPDTARSYNNAAMNLNALGQYGQAQPLFEKALAIGRQVLGEQHPDTATGYNNVAFNLDAQGQHAQAQPLYEKALAIRRQALGEQHPVTAGSYHNVGANLAAQGQYAQAQPLVEKALAVRRQVLGEQHPLTAQSYNNVAFNLNAQGKVAQAQPLFEKALAVRRQVLGEQHPLTARSYNNVAFNLDAQGQYAQAQPLVEKALAIRRQVLGEQHPDTAQSYNNVAFNLNAQAKFTQAQPLYKQALAIRRQVLGEQHPLTARSYNNVAFNLDAQGQYAQAQPLYEQALAICRQVLGEQHHDTAQTYINLGVNLAAQGRTRQAVACWEAACRSFESARLHAAGTGFDRSLFQREFISPRAFLASALAGLHEPEQAWQHAEAHLARGLLDDLDPTSRQNPGVSARLAQLDEQLVPLLGRSNLSVPERARRDALLQEADALRKALSEAAAARAAKRLLPLEKVQAALPADTAVVFWLDVLKHHWACVVRHAGPPIWQPLPGTGPDKGWTADDDTLAQRTYTSLVLPHAARRESLLVALRTQRLEPVLPHLNGIQRLLIVPTGLMARLPLEALTDRFTISYIPSPSVFAQLQQRHRRLDGHTLLALGDPAFTPHSQKTATPPDHGLLISAVVPGGNAAKSGLKPGDILLRYNDQPVQTQAGLKLVEAGPPVPAQLWRDGQTLPVRLPAGKLGVLLDKRPVAEALVAWQQSVYAQVAQRSEPIAPLPGTKVEVAALAPLVPHSKLLLGSDASEQTLEQLAQAGQLKRYRLIHLATHGQVNEGVPTESALLLAQDRISHKLDDQLEQTLNHQKRLDGRLTVGTILDKWQLDADQVVLSACETGLGTNAWGEGLLGFAQALLQKGAHSVVLSRWKVDDAATALLMERYYQNILGKRAGLKGPLPRAEGLREAKQWLRSLTAAQVEAQVQRLPGSGALRSVKPAVPVAGAKAAGNGRPFAAPYYWAAFVLIGDPD
jgi:tetratricopeptide (TPR) repeat protein